jgi:hypothetical protein
MHKLASIAWRSAQITGEIRDVSANIGVALQHFVPAMCLFRHTPPDQCVEFLQAKAHRAPQPIFFLSKCL